MKVFLSHSSKDKWAARRIASEVEALGATVFIDEKDIETGQSIDAAIKLHLGEADDFLLLLSPAALQSEWVLLELGGAMALGKNIVPILLYVGANELPKAITLRLARDINEVDKYYDELRRKLGIATSKKPLPKKRLQRITKSKGRYHKGDRVKIVSQRPDTTYRDKGVDFDWVDTMDSYLGQPATIVNPIGEQRAYELDIDSSQHGWDERWLVPDNTA